MQVHVSVPAWPGCGLGPVDGRGPGAAGTAHAVTACTRRPLPKTTRGKGTWLCTCARVRLPPGLRLQVHALHKLHAAVDFHWAEISEQVSAIEALFEAPDFPQRELAAAVASKARTFCAA